jgi:hypothetical protein
MRSRTTARLGGLTPAHGESRSAPRSTAVRTVAGGLRRLASQGDHDVAVDDLDVTDTNFSCGLESGFERRLARPLTQCGAPSAITRFSGAHVKGSQTRADRQCYPWPNRAMMPCTDQYMTNLDQRARYCAM